MYSRTAHDFDDAVRASRIRDFADQVSITLTVILRHADQTVLETQLREALATRAVIDQAIGTLMGRHRVTAPDAFALLREASQHQNRKLATVASDLIETITGQPPVPPRPFVARR